MRLETRRITKERSGYCLRPGGRVTTSLTNIKCCVYAVSPLTILTIALVAEGTIQTHPKSEKKNHRHGKHNLYQKHWPSWTRKKKFTFPCIIRRKKKKEKARKFLSAPWWLLENLTERAERKGDQFLHLALSVNCANSTLNKNRRFRPLDTSDLP